MIETYIPSPELEILQKLAENKDNSNSLGSIEFLIFELAQNCHTSRDFIYILECFPGFSTFSKEYILGNSDLVFTPKETLTLLFESDFQKIEDNDINEHYPYEEALIQKTQNFEIGEIPEDFLERTDIPLKIKKHLLEKLNQFDIHTFVNFTIKYNIGPYLGEILITKVNKISLEEADSIIQRTDLGHIQRYYLYKVLSALQVTPNLIESLQIRINNGVDGEHITHIMEACKTFELNKTNIVFFETGKLEFGWKEALAQKIGAITWGDFAKNILKNPKIGINIKNIFIQKIVCRDFGEFIVCITYLRKIKNIQISAFIENHPKMIWNNDTEKIFHNMNQDTTTQNDKNSDIEIFSLYICEIVKKISIPQEYHPTALGIFKSLKNRKLLRILADSLSFQTPFSLLDSIPETSSYIRNSNISRLNTRQRNYFTEKNIGALPQKRTFVFYYRKWQGEYAPHYKVFMELIQKYILSGKSKIWNDFRVVLRHHPQYSYDGALPFETENLVFFEKEAFRISTTIYTDTLSLNHGTFENIPGTFHMGGIASTSDAYKVGALDQEASPLIGKIPLNYYAYKRATQKHAQELDTTELHLGFPLETDIEALCIQFLEGIKTAEDTILEHIKNPRERVGSILEGR